MFIRNERSIKDFMRFYPLVSSLVIIYFGLWAWIDLLHLPFSEHLRLLGIGQNYAVSEGQYWRILTATFLHANFTHVLFNSFSLILFGPALEQMLGKFKFIFIYFGAGIIGNIATYVVDPTSFQLHLGASGAIYGLFGVYLFIVLFKKHLIDQQNSQIVSIIFIAGVVMTFIQPNINIYAHIFGAVGGFLLTPIVLTDRVLPFSMDRNNRKHRVVPDAREVVFDPNRWQKKKRIRFNPKIIWTILIILVLLGLFSNFR